MKRYEIHIAKGGVTMIGEFTVGGGIEITEATLTTLALDAGYSVSKTVQPAEQARSSSDTDRTIHPNSST